jgi:hypothetical protein
MGTKRTPLRRTWRRNQLVVSPEALAAWRHAKKLRKGTAEYEAAEMALQKLLGLGKFEATVLGRPSLFGGETHSAEVAKRWRAELEEADRTQP